MPRMSSIEYDAWLARTATKAGKALRREAAERETGKDGLHQQIMDYCNAQWPKWVFVHSRTDQPSTVSEGLPDFVIALPAGRTFWVECKAKGGKLTPEQLAWKVKLEMLGQNYAVVYSLNEFIESVK